MKLPDELWRLLFHFYQGFQADTLQNPKIQLSLLLGDHRHIKERVWPDQYL